jgi:hypothetical protein
VVRILLKFLRTYIYIYFVALTVLPLFTLSSESGNIPPILVEFQHTEAVLLLLCEFHSQSFSIQKSPSLVFSGSMLSFSGSMLSFSGSMLSFSGSMLPLSGSMLSSCCAYKEAFLHKI